MTFLIKHFDLFGLRQVWLPRAGKPYPRVSFRTPLSYRFVPHPLYPASDAASRLRPGISMGTARLYSSYPTPVPVRGVARHSVPQYPTRTIARARSAPFALPAVYDDREPPRS